MKRWLICGLLGAAALFAGALPFESRDVGTLRPVKTLLVSVDAGVEITADTGDRGMGETWAQAVENLRQTAPGKAFFGTGGYLLLTPEAEALLPEILADGTLRAACGVCLVWGTPDLEEVGAFLDAHRPETSINTVRAALGAGESASLPVLWEREGRLTLES